MQVINSMAKKWKRPPIAKIYEALGAVADGRIEVSGDSAKVFSSSGNKSYIITYDPAAGAIMANDNASFWKGYLGYPAIAYLMKVGAVSFDQKTAESLKSIAWKDINQRFKNDFDKALEYILASKTTEEKEALNILVSKIDAELAKL